MCDNIMKLFFWCYGIYIYMYDNNNNNWDY